MKQNLKFEIELDENHLPLKIKMNSGENNVDEDSIKALMISAWSAYSKETLRIDLWTKEMMVEEMKFFTIQILDSLGDTYMKSTNDEKIGNEIKMFAKKIGKMSNVLK